MFWLWILGAWFAMAVLTYGGTFAHEQAHRMPVRRDSEYRYDMAFAVFFALLGPFGFFISFFATGFYASGFKWR